MKMDLETIKIRMNYKTRGEANEDKSTFTADKTVQQPLRSFSG